ncbi:lytic transglycosylase domain-containing protein [bacterium]|nr:lytic transglycosylase domain-containing protein [bacterium]
MASQRGLGMAEQLYDKLLEKGLLPESISGGSASGKVNAFEQIRQFDAAISTAASAHEVEPALIYAVIQAESGGNPHAVSMKGAKGLMQLMDGTAREMGVANVFQPRQNIDGGVQYLKAMLARFDGDTSKALAAYNAGPGTVESYGGVPPFKETQKYVEHVMELLEFYRQQLDQSGQS